MTPDAPLTVAVNTGLAALVAWLELLALVAVLAYFVLRRR